MDMFPVAQRARRARLSAAFWLISGAALLSGCGSLVPTGDRPDLYTLTPKTTFGVEMDDVKWQLVIEEPVAAGGLNSSRIALKTAPTRFEYFSGARWTERAPVMVQTLTIESFETTNRIVGLGRQAIGLRSDYNLKLELREFQAEYFEPGVPPTVRVRLNAKLVRQPRQQIIASRSFEVSRDVDEDNINDIVEAFDKALGRVMKQIVPWALHEGNQDYESR